MKKLSVMVLVCVLLVGVVSAMTLAAGAPGSGDQNAVASGNPKPPMPGEQKEPMGPGPKPNGDQFAQLNLTVEQQKKMLEIRQNFEKEALPLRLEMEKTEFELRVLWDEKQLNQKAIEAKEKEKVDLKIQLTNLSRAMFDRVKSVLTPEQQKQFQMEEPRPEHGFPGQDRPFKN